ncbi:hypothetical protein FI667_g17250, partial [Globisporangium splendens]
MRGDELADFNGSDGGDGADTAASSSASLKRAPSETHTYELCLVGNLRDFGYAHPGAHAVHGIPVHVDAAIVQGHLETGRINPEKKNAVYALGMGSERFRGDHGRTVIPSANSRGSLLHNGSKPLQRPSPRLPLTPANCENLTLDREPAR